MYRSSGTLDSEKSYGTTSALWRSHMKVGDLVKTPKIHKTEADMAAKHGLGLGYYDWEGRFGVIVGLEHPRHRDDDDNPFVRVRIQTTGKLCVFSSSVLTKIKT
jgi:hypothetical protein